MSSFPEWPKQPPPDPTRPDVEAMFGPGSRYVTYPTPSGPQLGPPPEPGPPPKLNPLAVVAFVLAFVVSPAAIVLGVIARGQTRRNRESGEGLATAAIVLGSVFTVLGVVAAALLGSVLLNSVPGFGPPVPAVAAPAPSTAPLPSFAAGALSADLTRQLARSGNNVRDASCPQDLLGVPGQTVRCTVVFSDGQPTDMVVTVTAVHGGSIDYTWRPEARAITRTLLESRVTELLAQQSGTRPVATSCAGELPPVVGRQVSCTVTVPGGVEQITVTTTGTAGGQLSISITPR